MAVFVRSALAISPQNTFEEHQIPEQPVIYTDYFQNILPDFKTYFNPIERRRMSRIIKSGAVCAIEAIQQAGIEKPDMIISGTGLGCVEDTEKFLNEVLTSETSMHAPTAFVQSTHNSIGALIAVRYQCHGYNVLYANKTVSFESGLLDALIQFRDKKAEYILLNGFDELTQENYNLKKRAGLFKSERITNLDILSSNSIGSMPGEGTSSFVLTDIQSPDNLVRIDAVEICYSLPDQNDLESWVSAALAKEGLQTSDIDLVVLGNNGDITNDTIYKTLTNNLFPESVHAYYKHLCGDYDTASAFGLWFFAHAMKAQILPDHCILNKKRARMINRVLLYNQDHFKNHALILLSKC